jgi:hypothetical protein
MILGTPVDFLERRSSTERPLEPMPPKFAAKGQSGGIERGGVWDGKNRTLFPRFPEMKSARDAASDHAALWCFYRYRIFHCHGDFCRLS